MEQLFAPPNDPVFELVPPDFDVHAKDVFQRIGAPAEIRMDNFWEVFQRMFRVFEAARAHLAHHIPYTYEEPEGEVRLLEGYQEMLAPGPLNLQFYLSNQSAIDNEAVERAQLLASALPMNNQDTGASDDREVHIKKEPQDETVKRETQYNDVMSRLMHCSEEELSREELLALLPAT